MKLLKTLSIVVFISFIAIACGAGGGGNDGGSGSLEKCENSCNGSGEAQMWCMMGCANDYGDADGDGDSTSYPDADGDGYDSNSDCDDNNVNVNPRATEICGDNIDQDCNGSDLDCPYTDNGNDTVTDNVTGLIWQQEDDNQEYNWYEASGNNDATSNPGTTDVCVSLTLAGYSDWRLPNTNELKTLVDFFPNADSRSYWSSTTPPSKPTLAYYVFFRHRSGIYDGYSNTSDGKKTDDYYVRCVRGVQ